MRAPKRLVVETAPAGLPEPFAGWFKARGWLPHAHQLALLSAAGIRTRTSLRCWSMPGRGATRC